MTEDKEETAEAAARAALREFCSTEAGRKFLYVLLIVDLGILREAHTSEEMALRNYGVQFVRDRLGLRDAAGALAVVGEILKHGK